MEEQQSLLEALKRILHHRKTNEYFSEKLGFSVEDIKWAREELKKQGYVANRMTKDTLQEESSSTNDDLLISGEEPANHKFEENVKNGTAEATFTLREEIHNLQELIEKCNIDTSVWQIDRYVQNYWGNADCPRWQVKAWMSNKELSKPKEEQFQEKFIEFIQSYKSDYTPVPRFPGHSKKDAVMIIPKQDFHFDKLDQEGQNDPHKRQHHDHLVTNLFVEKAATFYNLKKVYYVLGSDYFNAEFTKTTTKGTPQQNAIEAYHESFNQACIHEIYQIQHLLKNVDEVEVIFIPGNHDYYVGWHLVQYLAGYFRHEERISFDASKELDKCVHAWDTAVMLRHGNDIKPQALANIFPAKYRKQWANSNHTYIITGDKHSEKSADYGATRHYQVPALSSSKSLWDQNNGYVVTRTEHSAFIIEENKGISDLFREYTA
jgi:hypothetical protein